MKLEAFASSFEQAVSICENALRLAMDQGEPVLPGTADLYVGISDLHREWGDIDAAIRYLWQGEELGVNSRQAAVRRAEELDLLERTRKHQPQVPSNYLPGLFLFPLPASPFINHHLNHHPW